MLRPIGLALRGGLITTGRSPHACFSVGPTVLLTAAPCRACVRIRSRRIALVPRFYLCCALSGVRFAAALLLPAGPPTLALASGPPSCWRLRPVGLAFASAHAGSLRYAASIYAAPYRACASRRPYYYRPVPPRSGGSGRYCVVRGARSSASSCT